MITPLNCFFGLTFFTGEKVPLTIIGIEDHLANKGSNGNYQSYYCVG